MSNPFVRVSLPHGHYTVPLATAIRGGWEVLEGHDAVDLLGRPLPPKPRVEIGAATPTDAEGDSADTEEKE